MGERELSEDGTCSRGGSFSGIRRGDFLSPPSVTVAGTMLGAVALCGLGFPGASSQRNGTVTGVWSDGVVDPGGAASSARDRTRTRGSAVLPSRQGVVSVPMLSRLLQGRWW